MLNRTDSHTRAEHQVAERPTRWIDRTLAAFVISFGGVFIGGWISVAGNDIRDASRGFLGCAFRHCGDGLDVPTLGFWIVVLLWAGLLALRLRADGQRDTERLMALIRAIHRAPNLNVFRSYPRDFIPAAFASLYDDSDNPPEARIRAVLHAVAGLASDFARASREVRYGANIMLLSQGKDFPERLFSTLRFDSGDVRALALVAHLPDSLCVDRAGQEPENVPYAVPRISLPVPHEQTTSVNGHEIALALPGAPTALLVEDGVSVQEQSSTMGQQCAGLGDVIAEQIKAYFAASGAGADIRSFVSFRIERRDVSGARHPVGVLNIDSDTEFLLGRDPEYYVTFFALISPILAMLGPLVEEYAETYWQQHVGDAA